MHRFALFGTCVALLATQGVTACGNDKGGRAADTATTADTSADTATSPPEDTSATEVTSTETTPDTATTTPDTATATPDTETPTPDTTPVETQVGGCSEDDLEACEYPSRGLNYVERDGFATTEPHTGRTLPLLARIPVRAGPLPVVIWSHGGDFKTGGQLESVQWGDLSAKHGYVAIHVGHVPLSIEGAKTLCELTGAIRRMPFPLQPGDGKRALLYSNLPVGVGGHGTFNLGDTGSNDARLDRLTRAIGSVARAVLDGSLHDEADAKAWLATDKANVLAGDVDWLKR